MINAIDPNQLLMQMRAAQAQATQQTQVGSQVNPTQNGVDFVNVMKSAVDQVNETQVAAGKLKTAFEMGDPRVSLADTMIASQKASVAFQATVQVRNKIINAYEEVMRMSV
jgi:flagellar hook-basal body complex protein FliE